MRIKLTTKIAKEQRKSALRLLRKLKSEMPADGTCYIAGGAPRDWHHGWGCRDIDIFYCVPSDPEWIPKSFKRLSDTCTYASPYYKNGYIRSVTEYSCTSGTLKYRKVQFIHTTENPLNVIKCEFPISLSRIWMGIDGKIVGSDEYELSYDARIIFELDNKTYNYIYLDKILGRFSQYCFMPHNWEGRRNK